QTAVVTAVGTVFLAEILEDMRKKIRIDANSCIGNGNPCSVRIIINKTDADFAGSRRELHSVRKEIPDHLVQAFSGAPDKGRSMWDIFINGDVFGFGSGAQRIAGSPNQFRQVNFPYVQANLPEDDARDRQNVVNQPGL